MPNVQASQGGRRQRALVSGRANIPGLLVCSVAVAVSMAASAVVPVVPPMTTAVVLGILFANLPVSRVLAAGTLKSGLAFAGRRLLRVGIVLLGLKLSILDILDIGWAAFAVVLGVVVISFASIYALGRLFRLPGDAPLLIAAGFSICGASAVGAMAAARGSKHEETVLPIALVTICGTLAIGVLPLLMSPLSLSPLEYGRWVGTSVHDVGQVVATAQVAGHAALAIALVFKLARVLLLAPMVSLVAISTRRRAIVERRNSESVERRIPLPPVLPLFIVGFLVMILLRSSGLVNGMVDAAALVQEVLLVSALFALGCGVRLSLLLGAGRRAAVMALVSWLALGVLALLGLQLVA